MKRDRHKAILSLIETYNIDRQEVLLQYLKEEGFNVTQATVSRDIKDLNLVKISSANGGYKYAQNIIVKDTKAAIDKFDYIISESISSVDYSANMVVVKCYTAMAQPACEVFDNLHWDGVIGTLAGENTFFIVTKGEDVSISICNHLRRYIK